MTPYNRRRKEICEHILSLHIADIASFVPVGSPSRGGDVTVDVVNINQPNVPTPFYSVLVFLFVCMALSTVFHSVNLPDNSTFSHSVLRVIFCLIGPFNYIYIHIHTHT